MFTIVEMGHLMENKFRVIYYLKISIKVWPKNVKNFTKHKCIPPSTRSLVCSRKCYQSFLGVDHSPKSRR